MQGTEYSYTKTTGGTAESLNKATVDVSVIQKEACSRAIDKLPGHSILPPGLFFAIALKNTDDLAEVWFLAEITGRVDSVVLAVFNIAGLGGPARGDFFPKHGKNWMKSFPLSCTSTARDGLSPESSGNFVRTSRMVSPSGSTRSGPSALKSLSSIMNILNDRRGILLRPGIRFFHHRRNATIAAFLATNPVIRQANGQNIQIHGADRYRFRLRSHRRA